MEPLFELLQTPLYEGIRVKHVLQAVIVVVLLRAVWGFIRPKKAAPSSTTAPAACGCGWRGQASRHAPRCPRCGKPAFLQ